MFLQRRGCRVLARNVRVGRGEIDLIMRDGAVLVAVEVKSGSDPLAHFTESKIEVLRQAMGRLVPRPTRLDLVTVTSRRCSAEIRWYRGFA